VRNDYRGRLKRTRSRWIDGTSLPPRRITRSGFDAGPFFARTFAAASPSPVPTVPASATRTVAAITSARWR